jgi:hypothetical protein
MKIKKKILSMGIILLIAGIAAALFSFWPSGILPYIFVIGSLSVGVLGILTGRNSQSMSLQATSAWIGFALVGLAAALMIWGTSLMVFINVIGLFLLIWGFVEFVFVLQILNHESPIPWKLVGVKLAISAITATGGAWIFAMAGFGGHMALFIFGLLFITLALSFIQIGRFTERTSPGRKIDSPV